MKANFALTLSLTGLRLLHRAAGGWRFVGEVDLGEPDLDAALASLRRTALELEPSGLRTKLVLPNNQVRYLTIDSTGDDLHAAARAALEGATPYPVSQLVFDLSPDGDRTHIAATARETLREAEAFAVKHRFAPISIVGLPQGKAYLGEPFFGPTDYANHVLRPGQSVEPDGIAVVELGPSEVPEGPVVTVTQDTPVVADDALPASTGPMPLEVVAAGATDVPTPNGDPTPVEDAPRSMADGTEGETKSGEPGPGAPAIPSVGFASRRKPGSDAAPRLGGVSRRFDPTGAAPAEHPPAAAAAEVGDEKATAADDLPDPPAAVVAAFLSRRRPKTPEHDPRDGGQRQTPPAPPPGSGRPVQGASAVPAGSQAAARVAPEIPPARIPKPLSERQRMTVFGARKPDPGGAAVIGGNSRVLGLVLTAVLLLFLAGVAAWAAVFIDDGLARFFGPRTPATPVTAEAVEPGTEADALPSAALEGASPADEAAPPDAVGIPDLPETDVETASLDPELAVGETDGPDTDARAEPEPPTPFDPEEAAAQYAVTGIWTIPPDVPTAPGVVDVDDLYLTSIDPPGESLDALALLPGRSFDTDQALLAPANPAPPGTEFDLDERGLVRPTPEGALSPDGIMVHSGPPPVVPPDTLERSAEQPEDVDAAAREGSSGIRPRARPDDLVENTERRQLGGHSRSELAEFRPRLRPETIKQAEEADVTPTAQAVARSARPTNRPGNFAEIVARAVERNTRAAAVAQTNSTAPAQSEQVASVAPRAVVPAIPSRSSVATEATVRNAINLRRMNLMGVYGSPSNRRALVRLSNGRYMKVKVGDRLDGGRVSAIGDSELSYTKGNRNIVLTMPRT